MEGHQIVELVQTILFVIGAWAFAYSPIAVGIGKRIMHGKTPAPGARPVEDHRVDDLSGEVAALRQALDEQQERLDFAERLIAQVKARDVLPGAR